MAQALAEVRNGVTLAEVMTTVNGSKFKAFHKYKKYICAAFAEDDLLAECDLAVFLAWSKWDPKQTKINSYVTSMLDWHLIRVLENVIPLFKATRKTTTALRANGLTFASLSTIKKTPDEKFNETHSLDGVNEFTRDHYNAYVSSITRAQLYPIINNGSDYLDADGEGIDVIDSAPDQNAAEGYDLVDLESELDALPTDVAKLYRLRGYDGSNKTLSDSYASVGTTAARIKTLYKNSLRERAAELV